MTIHQRFCFRSVRRAFVAFAALGTTSCHGAAGSAPAPDDAQVADDSPPILVGSPAGNADATACDDAGPGGGGCSTMASDDAEGATAPGGDASLDSGGLTCTSGSLRCGGVCVPDDVHNCGACGVACPTEANGTAICNSSDAGLYACGSSCLTGFSPCGGACVDLTGDVSNCGACGQSCAPGACSAGQCQPWLVAQADSSVVSMARASLATDGNAVVWLDPDEGVSEAPIVPVPNETPIVLAPPTSGRYVQVAMANGVVAWTESDPNVDLVAWTALEGQPNSGSTSNLPGVACTGFGVTLNSTGTAFYFSSDCGTAGDLWACNLGGSVRCPDLEATNPSDGSNGNDVAVASNYLFLTDSEKGAIWRYDLASNSQSEIETDQGTPFLLTVDSSFVYWASGGPNLTFSVSRTSQANPTSPPQPVVPATGGIVTAIATDGTNLYLSGEVNDGDTRIGVIGSVPVAGGAPLQNLYSGTALPVAMATAGGVVVWLSGSDYAIYALRLP